MSPPISQHVKTTCITGEGRLCWKNFQFTNTSYKEQRRSQETNQGVGENFLNNYLKKNYSSLQKKISGWKINICDVCMANLFIYDQFMWLQLENYYGFIRCMWVGKKKATFLLKRYKSFGVKGIEICRNLLWTNFSFLFFFFFFHLFREKNIEWGSHFEKNWPENYL